MTSTPSADATNLNWLISNFVDQVPGVTHSVVLSSDGLLLTMSDELPRDRADQLAAVAAGLSTLAAGASRLFDGDGLRQTVVEMNRGFLLLMSISDGSVLAAVAAHGCDIGMVGFEMARLVKQAGQLLTPALRTEMRGSLRR